MPGFVLSIYPRFVLDKLSPEVGNFPAQFGEPFSGFAPPQAQMFKFPPLP